MAGKKKNYIEIVESDWTNGVNSRDLFVRLNAMEPGEIQSRIDEIGKAIEEIDKEISKIARKARRSQRAGASKEELEASQQEIDNLTDMQIQLEDERDMLELFPRVKSAIDAIDAVRTDMMAKSASQSMQIKDAEKELKAIEEQEKEAKAKLDRAKEIDAEIAEKKKEIAALNGKRPKVMVAIQEEIDELGEEKEGLISKKEYTAIKTALITKRSDVGKLKAQKAKTEKTLELCEDPWNKILGGYEWEDIAELSDADLSGMLGVEVDRRNQDKDKDKGDEGRGGRQGGFGGRPIQPTPPTPPEPEAEQEPEENEEEAGDEGPEEKGWFTRKIEEWKANREAKKEAKKAFIEKFRLIKGREPNWWERFKAKYPKIFEEKNKRKTVEEIIEATKAAKERTPEAIEAARELIKKNKLAKAQAQERLNELEAQKTEEEKQRTKQANELKLQLSQMTSGEIMNMKPLYGDILSGEVFDSMYARALMRETKKENKKETKPQPVSSSRVAHRSFAKGLGGTTSSAPVLNDKAVNTPAQVAEKSAPSAPNGVVEGNSER